MNIQKFLYASFYTIIGILAFSSCSKDEIPDCIQNIIDEEQNSICLVGLDRYEFMNQTVYLFDFNASGCADFGSEVITSNCDTLCFLGGIAGVTECQGVSFTDNSRFIERVWEK